jgi:hypothetical protein
VVNRHKCHVLTLVVSRYPTPAPINDFVYLFLPPCDSHMTPLATGSLESGLLVSPLLGGPARHRPFTPTLHLHQRKSSRNLHIQYLVKSQSKPRCQSLITAGSDHPPVLGRSDPQPVQVWTDPELVFVVVRMLGLVQVVVVLVVGMGSLQVISLLGILPLVLNTGMGGVVALRWRGGMVHRLPFVVLFLLQLKRGWFPRSGYRGGVRGGSFDRRDALDCANPTMEQMARHLFYSFGTNPSAESFVHSRACF